MNYQTEVDTVSFSYKGLPALFFVTLAQLDILVQFTGNRQRPYFVNMSESEFLSAIELSQEI